MGICFFCPNGHPLNVKTELAGKVGLCPKCKVKMRIPLQSMREVDDKEYRGQPTAEAVVTEDKRRKSDSERAGDQGKAQGEFQNPVKGAGERDLPPTGESMNDLIRQVAEGSTRPPQERKRGSFVETMSLGELSNAPDVLWYVISPEGQKYGPAQGPVLLSWINERRVGPKTLLLRTGWNAPLEAGQVFPEIVKKFGGNNGPDNVLTANVGAFEGNRSAGENDVLATLRNQQRRTMSSLYVMGGLTFVLICAVGVLIWILLAK